MNRSLSRSGLPILSLDGKHLCSTVDPRKESQKWVEAQSRELQRAKAVIVLGAGCGYHLSELRKSYPGKEIVAIDQQMKFIDFCLAEHSIELTGIEFICATSLGELRKSRKLKPIFKSTYAVLVHQASVQFAPELYEIFLDFLLVRSVEGVQFAHEVRSDIKQMVGCKEGDLVPAIEGRYVSIKDLVTLVEQRPEVELNHPQMIVKALRELLV